MLLVYFLKAKAPLANLSAVPTLIVIWIPATLILDYVSLCESRAVISEMGKVGTGGVILLLIGDLFLTFSIFVAVGSFVLMSAQDMASTREAVVLGRADVARVDFKKLPPVPGIPGRAFDPNNIDDIQQMESIIGMSEAISHTINLTASGLPFWREEKVNSIFGIFFCSTFITSVWVWLYALGGWVIKAVEYLGLGTGKLKRWLDIENQPMRAIGYVCMMLVTVGFIIAVIF